MPPSVLDGRRRRGFYEGYRYLVSGDGAAQSVVFLNAEREISALRSLLITTALVAVISLAAVFILVLLLARRGRKALYAATSRCKSSSSPTRATS